MGLIRQLLTVACGLACAVCVLALTFLTIQRFIIIPSTHPIVLAEQQKNSVLPESLLIPNKPQPLTLIPTPVKNNDWQLSSEGVSLLQTQSPNQGKIMYGHNWPSLLGSLHQSEIGDTIQVRYSDHSQEAYVIQSVFTVEPSRLDVLDLASDPNSLLIYTCSGWFDRERFVVIAYKSASVNSVTSR